MRCINKNNANKLGRAGTKMSEDFHDENKVEYPAKDLKYFHQDNSVSEIGEEINVIDHMYATNTDVNGVIATTAVNETADQEGQRQTAAAVPDNCQTLEEEVKFIKEWLILHTDLIQQQNDDILDKDREIYILRKENEMLRRRISCIEKGVPLRGGGAPLFGNHLAHHHNHQNSYRRPVASDMTQGSFCDEDAKENIEQHVEEQVRGVGGGSGGGVPLPIGGGDDIAVPGAAAERLPAVGAAPSDDQAVEEEEEEEEDDEFVEHDEDSLSVVPDSSEAVAGLNHSGSNSSSSGGSSFSGAGGGVARVSATEGSVPPGTNSAVGGGSTTVDVRQECAVDSAVPEATVPPLPVPDTEHLQVKPSVGMKNPKMSIRSRRKRASCSSGGGGNHVAVEANVGGGGQTPTTPIVAVTQLNVDADKETPYRRRVKKKKRRPTKEVQMLTTPELYITQAHEVNLGIATPDPELPEVPTTLEVPRWRHKIYASCYTMEGTENLDDEVFNKRHLRLENDERRRKRWDVQRIREQRVIEKLKQRQERISLGGGVGGSAGGKGDDCEAVRSLWPKADDVRYLEVCDEVPVAAFGNPVPRIQPSEFVLPWLNNPAFLTRRLSQTSGRRSTVRRKSSKR